MNIGQAPNTGVGRRLCPEGRESFESPEPLPVKLKTRVRSCLGCMASEDAMSMFGTTWCQLGYKTKKISGVAGAYGKGGILIRCNAALAEPCPKPWTVKEYVRLRRLKEDMRV